MPKVWVCVKFDLCSRNRSVRVMRVCEEDEDAYKWLEEKKDEMEGKWEVVYDVDGYIEHMSTRGYALQLTKISIT